MASRSAALRPVATMLSVTVMASASPARLPRCRATRAARACGRNARADSRRNAVRSCVVYGAAAANLPWSQRIGGYMAFRLLPWRRPRINVVEMHGLIAPRPGAVSMGTMAPLIDRAFRSARGLPVILDIESPGGSPVQSDLIAALVRRRAEERKVRRARGDPRGGRVGRLLARVCRGRNPRQSDEHRGLDRRARRRVRVSRHAGAVRCRAAALHRGCQQGAARSVQSGEAGGCRVRAGIAGCAARTLQGVGADARVPGS